MISYELICIHILTSFVCNHDFVDNIFSYYT